MYLRYEETGEFTFPPTLQEVTGGVFCTSSGLAQSSPVITAMGLTTIGSDSSDPSFQGIGLVVVDYPNLTTMNFPNLTSIGSDFIIARNPVFQQINGFQALRTVSGNLDITGDISTLLFPNLMNVHGNIHVVSSMPGFPCSGLNSQVQYTGGYQCIGAVPNPQPLSLDQLKTNVTFTSANSSVSTTSTSPTSTQTSSATSSAGGTSGTSTLSISEGTFSAKRVLTMEGVVALLLVVAGLVLQ